ncbi:MAG TPA: hypothetical protein VM011_13570 [Gammaproteobacteria bacterium]|nr:hypothetical protein [Gammaproteobacteria bacterium]
MKIEPAAGTPAQELERIIKRMQKIQRAIKASRQPASMLELEELKALGRAYARIIDRLANEPGDAGFA